MRHENTVEQLVQATFKIVEVRGDEPHDPILKFVECAGFRDCQTIAGLICQVPFVQRQLFFVYCLAASRAVVLDAEAKQHVKDRFKIVFGFLDN